MFEESSVWWVNALRYFIQSWFYGNSWLSPVYYGVLFWIAKWLGPNCEWQSNRPIIYFVLGISLAHGALTGFLLSIPFWGMAPGGFNPIFFGLSMLSAYAFVTLVRSVKFTIRNDLVNAKRLLIRGGFCVAPVMVVLIMIASSFANMH